MIRVRKKRLKTIFDLAVFFLGFICAANILAQPDAEPDLKPVAHEMMGTSGITWAPKINYVRLELTVSRPDGTVFQKTFDSGSTPYLDLSSIFGDSNMDGSGSYTYELRVIPSTERLVRGTVEAESVRERMRQGHKALTQAGYFSVKDGAIVTGSETEPGSGPAASTREGLSRTQDMMILDDLIVDGSLCVGLDCVNGESFGFDTIRLKENNLRIKFQDTSNTASFPSNDWQITANDSADGGANKFSIDDIDSGRTPFTIEAGTRAHALYVDDSGRVGLGTSTPAEDLHIWYGDTPTIRLHQSGSGWAPQTWDVAGNEANFFIRDVTNGSTLPFRIIPGAPSNSLYINTSGYIGLGTTSPGFPLHIATNSSTNATIVAERGSGATTFVNATASLGVFGTTTDHNLRLVRNSMFQMDLVGNSDIVMQDGGGYNGTWNNASSRELKENIKDLAIDDAMEALVGLNPVTYNYKTDKEEPRVGFIAEDVPGLVGMKGKKNLAAMDIVSVLTKVVQEQQKSLKEQQESIEEQKKIISHINKRIADLEKNSK